MFCSRFQFRHHCHLHYHCQHCLDALVSNSRFMDGAFTSIVAGFEPKDIS